MEWPLFDPKWWQRHRRAKRFFAKLDDGAWLVVRFPDGTMQLGKHRPRREIEDIRAGFHKLGIGVKVFEFTSRKAAKEYIQRQKGEVVNG